MSVLLPAPLRPTRQTRSPRSMENDARSRTGGPPNATETSLRPNRAIFCWWTQIAQISADSLHGLLKSNLRKSAQSAFEKWPLRPCLGHPPDGVADVVRHEQRALAVDRHADRAAARLAVPVHEAGEDLDRVARGHAAGEGDEDH